MLLADQLQVFILIFIKMITLDSIKNVRRIIPFKKFDELRDKIKRLPFCVSELLLKKIKRILFADLICKKRKPVFLVSV